jgi:hypothetical protein
MGNEAWGKRGRPVPRPAERDGQFRDGRNPRRGSASCGIYRMGRLGVTDQWVNGSKGQCPREALIKVHRSMRIRQYAYVHRARGRDSIIDVSGSVARGRLLLRRVFMMLPPACL